MMGLKLAGVAALTALAACTVEPTENVEQQAEATAGAIEQRANELEAEAANVTGTAADTLENQQKALEMSAETATADANEAEPAVNSQAKK